MAFQLYLKKGNGRTWNRFKKTFDTNQKVSLLKGLNSNKIKRLGEKITN